jgi:hypothetical protein
MVEAAHVRWHAKKPGRKHAKWDGLGLPVTLAASWVETNSST